MASIVGKKISGKTYYYLVESARVGGKPRIVSQQYLGPADEVTARLAGSGPGEPERSRHLAFGDLAAVRGMLDRVGYAGIIDEVTGGRRSDASAGVGTYLALACANRVVAPRSKLAFADWWSTTAGARVTRVPWAALDHRRFWDAMDELDQAALTSVERRLATAMAGEFGLELSGMALDMTSFATYIDTGNDRAGIAQRGHAKQKRTDLRLVGLGMVVTRDGGVPLVGHAYPGNRNDVTVFPDVVDELVARYRGLAADDQDLTVVFDAGQNSAGNFAHLAEAGLQFVGSLPPSDYPDLLALPASRLSVIDAGRFPGLTGYETTAEALGATRRVLLTHSATLHARQSRGFDQTTGKGQTDPGHQPGALAGPRGGRRLPLPVRRRSRVPPAQGPARGVLLPDAPLDRPENPGIRLLLRHRPGHRPPDAPPGPRRRPGPICAGPAGRARRHPGNRAALPLHRRPAPRPAHAHRDDHDPAAPA